MNLTTLLPALWKKVFFLKGTSLKRLWNEKVNGKKYGEVGFVDYDQQLKALKVKHLLLE